MLCDVINHVAPISNSREQKKKKADDRPARDERPGRVPDEAQALAHPSRRRIAEALGTAPDGLTVAELAERVGLHPSAVRQHLEVLGRAGVVLAASSAPTGRRGRPSRRYSLAAPHGVAATGHRELVRLLVGLVRRAGLDEEDAAAFGREHGGRLVEAGARPAGLRAALAGLGFAPEEVTTAAEREAGEMELRLRACPFREAVTAEGGHIICALHRGLVEGALAEVAADARLVDFEPRDPATAGCRVVLEGLPPR